MTIQDVTLATVAVVMVSTIVMPLLAWAFCARPVRRALRMWRDVAMALAMARVIVVAADTRPPEAWGAVAWVHLAVASAAILVANIRSTLPPDGDRCEPKGGRQ